MLVTSILSFSCNVSTHSKTEIIISATFFLSCANAVKLVQSKIYLYGKKLKVFVETEFFGGTLNLYIQNQYLLSPTAQSVALQIREQEVTGSIPSTANILSDDDSHCHRIHSCLTAVSCFDNGYVGKQPVAWNEYYVEYWLTLCQTTNFRLLQTERVCRRQF